MQISPLVSSDLIVFSSQLAAQLKLIKTPGLLQYLPEKKFNLDPNQVTATRVSSYRVVINKLNSNVCYELTIVNKQVINIIIIGT